MDIVSNFKDYYDFLADKNSNIKYVRNMDNLSRVEGLEILRKLGMKTIELKPVSRMLDTEDVIVYTDLYKHNGKGKMRMSLEGARLMYPSKLCSKLYKESIKKTFKLLKIGGRNFVCIINNKQNLEMSDEPEDIQVKEVEGFGLDNIRIPIFSIDYVQTDRGMLASDFNTVENLNSLYMNRFITAEEVIEEIQKKLVY